MTLKTSDGAVLEGEEWLPSADASPAAGILLLHSFGNSRRTWESFPRALAEAGYRVLALDLRGHGGSSPLAGDAGRLLTDPEMAPRDLSAGLDRLRSSPGADRSRLAVIGASVGANLACLASGEGWVRTAVALSPHRDRVHMLAGGRPLHMASVLFLATSRDPDRESFARRLSLETTVPKEVRIFEGAEHGEAILHAHPEAVPLILEWLSRTL